MIETNATEGAVRSDTRQAFYNIFGEEIVVQVGDDALDSRIASMWAAFRVDAAAKACAVFNLLRRDGDGPIQHGGQLNTGKMLVILDRYKLVTASLGAQPWQVHVETFGQSDAYAYYYLFEPLLLMILKRRNLVHLHAAAVSRRGKIVLIVGEAGSGKSTTALSLVLDGYDFVADDDLFLIAGDDGVGVRSADPGLHFSDATAALFKGVPEGLPLVRRGSEMKRLFESGASGANVRDAPIAAVVFPRVERGGASRLSVLPAAEAMRRLVLQPPKEYPAVIQDAPSLERQFATAATLAATAKSFELTLGRDIAAVPRLIDEVIE